MINQKNQNKNQNKIPSSIHHIAKLWNFYIDNQPKKSKKCQNKITFIYAPYYTIMQVLHWTLFGRGLFGGILGVLKAFQRHIRGTIKAYWRHFGGILVACWRRFEGISKAFQQRFKGVLKAFQRCFEGVSKVF